MLLTGDHCRAIEKTSQVLGLETINSFLVAYYAGVSQNRRRLLDFDGRWGKLGLGKKIKDDLMGRGGVPPLSLVGAILLIF